MSNGKYLHTWKKRRNGLPVDKTYDPRIYDSSPSSRVLDIAIIFYIDRLFTMRNMFVTFVMFRSWSRSQHCGKLLLASVMPVRSSPHGTTRLPLYVFS